MKSNFSKIKIVDSSTLSFRFRRTSKIQNRRLSLLSPFSSPSPVLMGRVRLATPSLSESEDERVTIREAEVNREEVAEENKVEDENCEQEHPENLNEPEEEKIYEEVDDEEPMQSQGMEEDSEEEEKEGEEEESEELDDEEQSMQPERMFFGPSEYVKTCKIGTRCTVRQTVKYLEECKEDLPWFKAHPQFRHVFHMPEEKNHMTQGMWMLLLRTARTEMDRECWFVVIATKSKADGNIDKFFLKIVDDVRACETSPWGRFTFDGCMEDLPFEAIPHLGQKFRDPVRFENECPRMCKAKFSSSVMKGFSLEEINEELESVKVISSVLESDYEEKDLLRRIVDGDDVDDGIEFVDPVVDSWRNRLIKERKRIFWKDMFEADVQARSGEQMEEENVPRHVPDVPGSSSSCSLKETIDEGFKRVMAMLAEHNERLVTIERRQAGESVPPFEKKVHSDVNKEKEDGGKNEKNVDVAVETEASVEPEANETHDVETEAVEIAAVEPEDVETHDVETDGVEPEGFVPEFVEPDDTSSAMVLCVGGSPIVEKETEADKGDDETPKKETKKKGRKGKGKCNDKKNEKKKRDDDPEDEDEGGKKKRKRG
ncbi:hypothetical protein [Arabidopsis thaliana]|uniref:Uncharacterized protein AT4g08600 n=1 Tax=Arabidopsis thaliana TaxID=3702 RepID=O22279_ARATH|nr:hypothetical protein [Arabidopsis thaliana]CAB77985.1 hypothetical protein [Arabidopsis thaliana]